MSPKVIVVDDEASSAAVVAKLLQRLDCEVTLCTRPERAVDAALSGEIDVVSLDLTMPGLDGHQVLALIRSHEHSRRLPSVPVITVTGRVSTIDKADALAGGFAAHLGKPVLLEALRHALARALTLRSELHRTRYTMDHEAVDRHVNDILDRSPDGDVRTTAGLALTLARQGIGALHRSLLLALEGQAGAARQPLLDFARSVRPLGARHLDSCLLQMADHTGGDREVLATATVLARAELDRVIFTIREQVLR